MKLKNLIFAFVLGTALAAGVWTATNMQRAAAELHAATVLPAPAELPEFALLDHNGASIDRSVFEGHWNLVFFGFTNCPDICPITLQVLSTAKRQLAESGFSPLPRIVLVSVDPVRDSPEKMAQYINAFGEGNLGITGDIDELRKLTSKLGIYFQKRDGDGDYYSVDHSSVIIVINPAGEFHALFSGSHTPESFVHDLPLLVATAKHPSGNGK